VRIRSLLAVALAPAVLSGCGGDAPTEDDERTASGQVLEGSVSDAMIPLERLKSQPPLARERPASGGDEDAAEDPAAEAATDEGPGENPLLQEGFDG
jgi:hypothetical protein